MEGHNVQGVVGGGEEKLVPAIQWAERHGAQRPPRQDKRAGGHVRRRRAQTPTRLSQQQDVAAIGGDLRPRQRYEKKTAASPPQGRGVLEGRVPSRPSSGRAG